MDYTKLFEEDEKTHCTEHVRETKYGQPNKPIISLAFKAALDRQSGSVSPYYSSVCSECFYPAEFFVMFCYYCEREFYGRPGVPKKPNDQCYECKSTNGENHNG